MRVASRTLRRCILHVARCVLQVAHVAHACRRDDSHRLHLVRLADAPHRRSRHTLCVRQYITPQPHQDLVHLTHTSTQTCANTHAHVHTHEHTDTRTHTRTHMHAHTHARARTHTHKRAHAHTRARHQVPDARPDSSQALGVLHPSRAAQPRGRPRLRLCRRAQGYKRKHAALACDTRRARCSVPHIYDGSTCASLPCCSDCAGRRVYLVCGVRQPTDLRSYHGMR